MFHGQCLSNASKEMTAYRERPSRNLFPAFADRFGNCSTLLCRSALSTDRRGPAVLYEPSDDARRHFARFGRRTGQTGTGREGAGGACGCEIDREEGQRPHGRNVQCPRTRPWQLCRRGASKYCSLGETARSLFH